MSRISAVASLFLLCSCFPFSAHDETLVGRYKLVATDTTEEMSLCWALDSGDCLGDGLPGPTVFAAGFDNKYIVTAIHPMKSGKATTQFFYIVRDPANENLDGGLPYKGIKGPFDEYQYKREKAQLLLPEFTRVFDDLK
tara:strand:+ start:967 stop:1383 length:417 start_codon:yes stop_codon:yes gene_type:complete